MTNNDLQMDRNLRGLGSLKPARSVWSEVERQLVKRERKLRVRSAMRYTTPALAASFMVALLISNDPAHQGVEQQSLPAPDLSIQKTVENAVRNARPAATFSSLQLQAGQSGLEALLVSAKPRKAEIIADADVPSSSENGADEAKKPQEINEF